jgi:hypothetical protein
MGNVRFPTHTITVQHRRAIQRVASEDLTGRFRPLSGCGKQLSPEPHGSCGQADEKVLRIRCVFGRGLIDSSFSLPRCTGLPRCASRRSRQLRSRVAVVLNRYGRTNDEMSTPEDPQKPAKAEVPPPADSPGSGPISVYRSYPPESTKTGSPKKKGTGSKKIIYAPGKTPPRTYKTS